MSRLRTWRVVEWSRCEEHGEHFIPFECECGREAMCPCLGEGMAAVPIAGKGVGRVFDTDPKKIPLGAMPEVIQCRKCGRMYSWGKKEEEVQPKEENVR